jgi:hypothetical protein
MASIPVNPLYEPGAPPLPIPLLSAQTALSYDQPTSCSMVAEEVLHPKIRHRQTSSRRVAFKSRSPSPFPDSRPPKSPSPSPSEGSTTSDSALSEASASSVSKEKIMKPPGESGRPESGGYNLQAAMNWSPAEFKKLKVLFESAYHPSNHSDIL